MAKYHVILENMPGSQLDHADFEVDENGPDDFSDQAKAIIAEWVLSPGDTIRIVEEDE